MNGRLADHIFCLQVRNSLIHWETPAAKYTIIACFPATETSLEEEGSYLKHQLCSTKKLNNFKTNRPLQHAKNPTQSRDTSAATTFSAFSSYEPSLPTTEGTQQSIKAQRERHHQPTTPP